MILKATLDIKFRAFGFDITKQHWEVSEPVPAELALIPGVVSFLNSLVSKIAYNAHGVRLTVTVV